MNRTLKLGGHPIRAYVDGRGQAKLDEDDIKAWIAAGWKMPTRDEELAVLRFYAEASTNKGRR